MCDVVQLQATRWQCCKISLDFYAVNTSQGIRSSQRLGISFHSVQAGFLSDVPGVHKKVEHAYMLCIDQAIGQFSNN